MGRPSIFARRVTEPICYHRERLVTDFAPGRASMLTPRRFACLFVTASLSLACTAPSERERIGADGHAIINGELDKSHQAVVALFGMMSGCTGTLLHVNGGYGYILTAAHCFSGGPLEVAVRGVDYDAPDQVLQVVDSLVHPDYDAKQNLFDFAMLKVIPAANALQQILPLAPEEDVLKVGLAIEHVGYGLVSYPNGHTSQRHHAFGTLDELYPGVFAYNQPNTGPCSGDSGGPTLVETAVGPRVAGVISFGDQDCKSIGVSGRVSVVYDDFIRPYVGDSLPQPDTSGSSSTTGSGGSASASSTTSTSAASSGAGGAKSGAWTAGELTHKEHAGDIVTSGCSASPGAPARSFGWPVAALCFLATLSSRLGARRNRRRSALFYGAHTKLARDRKVASQPEPSAPSRADGRHRR
jgi:uncharacterized membrane protein YgcG